ncbi:MAG: SAM-dependent methyltransferase [Phycisphaerales bacterium]
MTATPGANPPFVSRGGLKLRHALDAFSLDPRGLDCADLGCSTGGFTDCLLKAGARSVIAMDTGYGVLAYTLRTDPRVVVRERENALHAPPPPEGVDLVVIDAGWTPQRLTIPAALRWLRTDERLATCRMISLVKPHYENEPRARAFRGVLPDDVAATIAAETIAALPGLGVRVLSETLSPVRGSSARASKAGNLEWLVLLAPAAA